MVRGRRRARGMCAWATRERGNQVTFRRRGRSAFARVTIRRRVRLYAVARAPSSSARITSLSSATSARTRNTRQGAACPHPSIA